MATSKSGVKSACTPDMARDLTYDLEATDLEFLDEVELREQVRWSANSALIEDGLIWLSLLGISVLRGAQYKLLLGARNRIPRQST